MSTIPNDKKFSQTNTLSRYCVEQWCASLPLEVVFLELHGAITADGCIGFEEEFITTPRKMLGQACVSV